MLEVLEGQVQHGNGKDVGGDVHCLPVAYVLWGGKQHACQLHMQQGLYGAKRGGMYGMRGRHIQEGEWIGGVLFVSRGDVLGAGGSNCRGDVLSVPESHALGVGEHGNRRLQMQQGLYGGGRGGVLGVRGGGVQRH